MANVRWRAPDVRDRRPPSLRRCHHRSRWQRVGPELHLPSGPLSYLPFWIPLDLVVLLSGFLWWNNFWSHVWFDLCGGLVHFALFVSEENLSIRAVYLCLFPVLFDRFLFMIFLEDLWSDNIYYETYLIWVAIYLKSPHIPKLKQKSWFNYLINMLTDIQHVKYVIVIGGEQENKVRTSLSFYEIVALVI